MQSTIQVTEYVGAGGWSTNDWSIAVKMAGRDAARSSKLFSEIRNKDTDEVVGYATYDGKEC